MTSSLRLSVAVFATLFFLTPSPTHAASLTLTPSGAKVGVGGTLTENILVSSTDQAINAVTGTISFPNDLLQVVSISKANSVLSLWVADPTFSNSEGTITFSGIVPNPGYTGGNGRVLSIQFRAKKTGTASIAFDSTSQVLANDGNGTNILSISNPSTVVITASDTVSTPAAPASSPASTGLEDLLARITSSTHPDQTQWYSAPHAIFDWTNAQKVSAVRLGYDKNGDGVPSILYSAPISHKEIDLANGVWYFHVQEKGVGGWGSISSYRAQVDTVPPLPVTITFPNGTTTPDGTPITALFATMDALSGIDHYRVAVDGKEFTVNAEAGSKPYAIMAGPGLHMLLVQAYDKAGNSSLANEKFSVAEPPPHVTFDFFAFSWLAVNYVTISLICIAILGTLLFAAWYIKTHFTAYRRQLNRRLGLTHEHIHKEFDNLRGAITEEILTLEQTKSKRELTREEQRLVARFRKLLEEAEEAIEKDIENIPR